MHYIFFYDYVENILDRRVPHRDGHLGLVRGHVARGEIVLAGAFAEPADGAAFVFEVDDPGVIEAFVGQDPYVAAGLVTAWRIRPWTVVVGSAL